MTEKTLRVLEFDKIREMLSKEAVTLSGAETLLKITPYLDADKVRLSLKETDEAVVLSAKQGSIPISAICNIIPVVKRAEIGASLSFSELLNVARLLKTAREIRKFIDIRDFETDYPVLNTICSVVAENIDLEKRIFDCILSEDEMDDNASKELSTIRRKISVLSGKVREILNDIIRSSIYQKALQEPIITMRNERFVVPVKGEFKSLVPGVVHDTSQSGATLFIEPMKVVETNNEIRKLVSAEKEEIDRIVAELSALVAESSDLIISDYKSIIRLDIIFSKAKLAYKMNAICPSINEEGHINIKQGRHPLIDSKKVVPIDIRLGKDFHTLVITGPNTGGKTVSLKTLGLLTLMAQAGLHIPAKDGSEISVFKKVFADIGDEQSIEQSLSTFSSHMVNIVEIMKQSDERSLVLFDELGAGTDPTEGAALANVILKEVASSGAKIAATTHYSEVKLYALSTERVENAACEFDVETLRPTYRLIIGALGKSNAFSIAQRLGMDKRVIDKAKESIDTENIRFEDVVSKVEEMGRKTEKAKEAAEASRAEAERIKTNIEEKEKTLNEQKSKILDEARREAKELLEDAKEDIQKRIKQIEKATKIKDEKERQKALNDARRVITAKIDDIDSKLFDSVIKSDSKTRKKDVIPGTTVLINAMNSKGSVISKPDKDGNIEVQVGILKIKTHISTVTIIEEDVKEQAVKTIRNARASKSLSIKTEIDLRGQNLDEALLNVDKYIDDAVLAGMATVTIIHGKGTGVLRQGIHDYLKRNKRVKRYRLGAYGEGETGVTIVEF